MRIITQGAASDKLKYFECLKCGCVFEVSTGEYKVGMMYNEIFCYAVCPCCNQTTYNEIKEDTKCR